MKNRVQGGAKEKKGEESFRNFATGKVDQIHYNTGAINKSMFEIYACMAISCKSFSAFLKDITL